MHATSLLLGPARRATFVLVVVALVVAAPSAPPDAAAAVHTRGEEALEALVDDERQDRQLPAMRVCADLRDLARRWSDQMADDGHLSHNPDLETQVRGWRSVGENVGFDVSVEEIHRQFMDSAAHRDHVLSAAYTEVGFGVDQRDGMLWVTQVFREPDSATACGAAAAQDERITTACPPDRVPPASFDDVVDNPHRAAIACTGWYGLTNGTSEDAFSPADRLNRAQIASFIARLAERTGLMLPAATDQGFTDIDGSVHADAINQLAALSIVQGKSPTVYGPDALVTRAQLATFLVRIDERIIGESLTATRDWFPDDDGLVHEHAIDQAAEAGFVAGLSPTMYGPHRDVRRDQLASSLARSLNHLVERGRLTVPG